MITWSCKAGITAFALTALSGCEGGQSEALFKGLGIKVAPAKAVALSQANMAFGSVTLIPPQGFCIDKASLQQNFAIMARCDSFGVPSAAGNAPVGIITASFSAAPPDALPSAQDTATAHALSDVTDSVAGEDSITFRAKGTAPAKGFSENHWRGNARINGHMMALAVHGPADGRAIGPNGRALLIAVIKGSRGAS